MSKIQKIGLLGGTFDPVHLGHLIIADSVLRELELDKVIFIPAHKHALKSNKKISSADTRLKLLEIALQDFPHFAISDFELKNDKVSFTIDTLKAIKEYENIPNAELFYIIGYDNLNELHLWKDHEKIMQIVKLVVIARAGNFNKKITEQFKENLIFSNTSQIDISSTLIRNKIKENQSWKSLVPPGVYQYIIKHNLYKGH